MKIGKKSIGKRFLAIVLTLLMVLSILPTTAMAATTKKAEPEKITLPGSDEALEYQYVDDLTYAWNDIPHYKVTVPAGTKNVQIYGTVYIDSANSSGSGYLSDEDLDSTSWPTPMEYWTSDVVGSTSPYTIETRIGETRKYSLVKTSNYADTDTAYFLEFVEADTTPSAELPVITTDLSTTALTYTLGDEASALSITAEVAEGGTLGYQWQMSTTSDTEGFSDIEGATTDSYTPSTEKTGNYWYRVNITNTQEGCKASSITSAVTPVTVNAADGTRSVKIVTSLGYSKKMSMSLKNESGEDIAMTADTSSGYAVYELTLKTGTYSYEFKDTVKNNEYKMGSGTLEVVAGEDVQTFRYYLAYVYASNNGSWTADDFTTEVKDENGNVMEAGEPHKFASYFAYPYILAPGNYTYTISPTQKETDAGYLSVSAAKTLDAQKTYVTWSAKLPQSSLTAFTVPKGAKVEICGAGTSPYVKGKLVEADHVDTTGTESDIYYFKLTVGSDYIYKAKGDGYLTNAAVIQASTKTTACDLTSTMQGSAKTIDRTVSTGAADIRLNGVDYTGSLALSVGSTRQLNSLRMWQISNNSSTVNAKGYTVEPDFHYTVLDVSGSNVVSVDENGLITANSSGTAIVLVTYDAMYVGNINWAVNKNKTFSAIWPENTGVVVVEVGDNAGNGPAANMTIGNGSNKVSGNNLDAEEDVLYYTDEDGCTFSFTPESGSTVTLLRPTVTDTVMTYNGTFSNDGVSAKDGVVTLTLTEGKNIVRISKDGADTYQVITVKKAGVTIKNISDPDSDINPGDTVQITLSGIYAPANWMSYLYNFYTTVSYNDPGSNTSVVSNSISSSNRYLFDSSTGDTCRTFTVTIPNDWDTSKDYTLTAGALRLYGNGKEVGSHRSDLSALSTSTPTINASAAFMLGSLPDITIPVKEPVKGTVDFSVKDDAGSKVSNAVIELTDSNGNKTTVDTKETSSKELAVGSYSYTVSKDGYLSDSGNVEIKEGSQSFEGILTLVTSLEIKAIPTKTSYIEGDTLDTTGLEVWAVTRSDSKKLDKSLYTVDPSSLPTPGEQTITVTFGSLSATFTVTVKEDIVDLSTTLVDGTTQKNSRKTFDVYAKDANGEKLSVKDVEVLLNGTKVSYNWDDSVKTSYTLKFTQEGENIVTIKAHKSTLEYKINYVKAEAGEVVGQAVFAIEAFTLEGNYIVEPCYVDILEGENAAQALDRLIKNNDFTYTKTGTLTSSFYLASIEGSAFASIAADGSTIPKALQDKLKENGFTISSRSDANSLGQFDYTYGSGWMFTLNNVFPNVGFADTYLSDGDVVRVQFTLAYGSDIGGGYSMGDGGMSGYFAMADKDDLTTKVAEVNAEIAKDADYLKKCCKVKQYEKAMSVLTDAYSTQTEVDEALANLENSHDLTKTEAKDPTNLEDGNSAYYTCSVCGKYFSDADAQNEIEENSWVIPALGADMATLKGDNRWETAALAAEASFPDGADTIVLTTGTNFPDALAANAFAGALNNGEGVPLLITKNDRLPDAIKTFLKDTWGGTVKKAYIIGATLSEQVYEDLEECGVENLNISLTRGKNRYETAELIARKGLNSGIISSDTVIISKGNTAADSLSVSTWSYRYKIPVLLAKSDGSLTEATKKLVSRFNNVIILGGSTSISTVENCGISKDNIISIKGDNRYDTSVLIASYFLNSEKYGGSTETISLAMGYDANFPDALMGGMFAAKNNTAILLVKAENAESYSYLKEINDKEAIKEVVLLGAAASEGVEGKVTEATGIKRLIKYE